MSVWLHVFLLIRLVQAQTPKKVTYGKYFRFKKPGSWEKDNTDNSYFLYSPPKNMGVAGKLPVIYQAYGNGWRKPFAPYRSYMGPFKHSNDAIGAYITKGMAYVSMGYRAVDTVYWYVNADHVTKMEELIHVDRQGRLSLDATGKRMADYKVRACWMELILKSVFDTVAGLENLISSADTFGIDVHRIFFQASSAGTAEVNYMSWVYHQWNADRYTPVGMMLMDPQFILPTFCAMGDSLKMWVDHAGPDKLIKDIMLQYECIHYLGNARCDPGMSGVREGVEPSEVCNKTWNDLTVAAFCGDNFETITIGEVYQRQRWDASDEVSMGLEKIWYTGRNMDTHAPHPFHLFVSSYQHGMAHGGMSAFGFAEAAHRNGLDYVVYYLDRPGWRKSNNPEFMSHDPEVIQTHFGNTGDATLLVRESFPWRHMQQESGLEEHVMYTCYVFKLPCAPPGLDSRWQSGSPPVSTPPPQVTQVPGMLISRPGTASAQKSVGARRLRHKSWNSQAPSSSRQFNETHVIFN